MLQAALNYAAQGFLVFPVNPDKTPLTEHGLRDATQLQTAVRRYWSKWPNAGIAMATQSLIVLDFDVEKGGLESKNTIEARYGLLPRTRIHRTGGGGLHFIYRNPSGADIRNTVALGGFPGLDLRANGGYIVVPPSLHTTGNRYEILESFDLARAPQWVIELATKKRTQAEMACERLIPEGQRNATLASLAGTMRCRGMAQKAIESALLEVNRLQCQPPLPEAEVQTIAKSISRYVSNGYGTNHVCVNMSGTGKSTNERDKYGTVNGTNSLHPEPKEVSRSAGLSERVQQWVEDTTGWWETSELDRDLAITSPRDRENRRKILFRMRKDRIIERHPKMNKQFRYVNTKVVALQFKTAGKTGVLPVKWPLGIERYVNVFPGNTAVVAGSPNSGKTALLLNFIHLNQDKFPIYYLCCEMGAAELRDRLNKFPGMDIEDWRFEAIERTSDFADVIRPDCVNIIDYLEMTTELYVVNTHLAAIAHRLGSGLAIVALQKKVGATYGRGQEFGMERPKLYLSMDEGRLQIVKGKSWATNKVNPNGLFIKFKIIDGCQFQATTEWDWIK